MDNSSPCTVFTVMPRTDFNYDYVGFTFFIGYMAMFAGLWHAFWMLPSFPQEIWPYSGEIDILEFANREGEYFYAGTMHHTGPLIGTDFPYQNENYFNFFHVYSIEWDLSTIKWYVDDVLIQNVVRTSSSVLDDNWPFDKEFHLILNTAVGGTLGGPPNLADQSHFMLVDYVRVYQKISN